MSAFKIISSTLLRQSYSLSPANAPLNKTFRAPSRLLTVDGKDSDQDSTSAYASLTQLGRSSPIPTQPGSATLERVPNPHPKHQYVTRFVCPEFTSICPITSQPDFAHIIIDYVPSKWLVESKSLKLYLASFRNHPDFHEACSVSIATRLVDFLSPTWLRLGAYWYPRGGIPIDVFYATGDPPKGVWVPEQGCPPYRGRG